MTKQQILEQENNLKSNHAEESPTFMSYSSLSRDVELGQPAIDSTISATHNINLETMLNDERGIALEDREPPLSVIDGLDS